LIKIPYPWSAEWQIYEKPLRSLTCREFVFHAVLPRTAYQWLLPKFGSSRDGVGNLKPEKSVDDRNGEKVIEIRHRLLYDDYRRFS
jgi:hypothetical protein